MTVGFVNAGLLSLEQAIGVVFGANAGTTITGQLVSFNLSDLALPAITLGVIGLMIAKRPILRGIWRTFLGFGLLFFGMTMMGHELKAVSKLPDFIRFFSLFDCTPSASGCLPIGSVLGAIAVGTLCTMLVQSSSATIGITIALAEAGIINLWTAVPIVLGDNIGTTITAQLASIGTNVNAKRTALAHALFNLVGTGLLVATFLLVFGNDSGVKAPAFFHLVDACTNGNGLAGVHPGRHVAMAHTLFNVTNVIVLAFFIPQLARLCRTIIHGADESCVTTLEPHLVETPALALKAVQVALAERISDLALKVSRKTERLSSAFVGAVISAHVSGVVSKVRKFAHETIDVARGSGQAKSGSELKTTEEEIRVAIREVEAKIWSDPQIRNAHPESALAILSIFHCLRDITRHLGNIAVRVVVPPIQ